MNDKVLGLLGMVRRSGKLSIGHDAAVSCLKSGKARLCVLSGDASQRLKDEMNGLCRRLGTKIFLSSYTMEKLALSIGSKSVAVLTVNDEGFAKRIIELTREE